jgi:GNAT superfamily N-acetyltransferase
MHIKYKKYCDWPGKIRLVLYHLSHKDDVLRTLIAEEPEILHTWVAFNGADGLILGWSVCYPHAVCFNSNPQNDIMLYVRRNQRRKGIGTRLYKAAYRFAKKKKKKIAVFPHDDTSYGFFNKMKIL